ncbi:DMT family transporter [Patescibacteria group bacterium]|nr:DMT family transporter [Patescibacteria group bacterium]
MSWFIFAIIGHLANGVAFVIDKILLRSAFTRSATYAGIVGGLSAFVILASPFVTVWPDAVSWIIALLSGALFILALWAFFASLSRADTSRVVPIVGSLIPMITLAGSFLFLGERLSDTTFIGFALLIVATFMLSSGSGGDRPSSQTIWLAVTSAFLFAIASVTAKIVYETTGFLGGFVATRIGAAVMSVVVLCVFDRVAGGEVMSIVLPKKVKKTKHKQPGAMAGVLALVGQSLGAVGFLFVQWATSEGSASVVNAMQAIQYALLVIVALIFSHRAPGLLGEKFTTRSLIVKIIALWMTAAGMYLIV